MHMHMLVHLRVLRHRPIQHTHTHAHAVMHIHTPTQRTRSHAHAHQAQSGLRLKLRQKCTLIFWKDSRVLKGLVQCSKRREKSSFVPSTKAIRSSTAVAHPHVSRAAYAAPGRHAVCLQSHFAQRLSAEVTHKAKLVHMLVGRCAVIHHSDCPHGRDRPPVEPSVAFQEQLVQVSRTLLLERERIHCCHSAPHASPRAVCGRYARRAAAAARRKNLSLSQCRSQSF